jgi:hypothetical protein
MQMYYFYDLTSVLASIGGSGQRRMSLRSEGSAFLPNRKQNAYSLERA